MASATGSFQFEAESHTYRKDGEVVLSITQVLAKAGICDFSCVEDEIRVRSMRRGQSVHWLLQLEDQGGLNYRRVPRGLNGYRKSWVTWKRHSHFLPLIIERPTYSPFGFAGTPDRVGTFPATMLFTNGSNGVVEIKTGEVPEWARYQLAAQCVLMQPNLSLARLMRRIGVTIRPDGTYGVREFEAKTWDMDFATFMDALKESRCQ